MAVASIAEALDEEGRACAEAKAAESKPRMGRHASLMDAASHWAGSARQRLEREGTAADQNPPVADPESERPAENCTAGCPMLQVMPRAVLEATPRAALQAEAAARAARATAHESRETFHTSQASATRADQLESELARAKNNLADSQARHRDTVVLLDHLSGQNTELRNELSHLKDHILELTDKLEETAALDTSCGKVVSPSSAVSFGRGASPMTASAHAFEGASADVAAGCVEKPASKLAAAEVGALRHRIWQLEQDVQAEKQCSADLRSQLDSSRRCDHTEKQSLAVRGLQDLRHARTERAEMRQCMIELKAREAAMQRLKADNAELRQEAHSACHREELHTTTEMQLGGPDLKAAGARSEELVSELRAAERELQRLRDQDRVFARRRGHWEERCANYAEEVSEMRCELALRSVEQSAAEQQLWEMQAADASCCGGAGSNKAAALSADAREARAALLEARSWLAIETGRRREAERAVEELRMQHARSTLLLDGAIAQAAQRTESAQRGVGQISDASACEDPRYTQDEGFRAELASLANRLQSAFGAGAGCSTAHSSETSNTSIATASPLHWQGVHAKLENLAAMLLQILQASGTTSDEASHHDGVEHHFIDTARTRKELSMPVGASDHRCGVEHHFIDTARTGKALPSPAFAHVQKRQLEEAMITLEEVRGMFESCESEALRAQAGFAGHSSSWGRAGAGKGNAGSGSVSCHPAGREGWSHSAV